MDNSFKTSIWNQFGASIDMIENAIKTCPDKLWDDRSQNPEYWYLVYHTLFWLDLYLSGSVEGFVPPSPFTLEELDPAGILPEKPYSKQTLRNYLDHCREKCLSTILTLNNDMAGRPCRLRWGVVSFTELILYNMRHVQHHAGQLNLILRQKINDAPRWVAISGTKLPVN
ncbi:MAG TPA: DinB family protein [Cyclobacteriaceae bacterium]|nr:DinB family protein [Cyclobacteriaceae bacterium]